MQEQLSQNMTQKEAFLKYLQRMDIEMLDMILDESIDYFGASKQVFLEKLSSIFSIVKSNGETGVLKIKKHKKQENTYYLIFRILSYSNKFIIEEQDGIIVKMYSPVMRTSKYDIDNLDPLEIFFGDDEKIDFKQSNDYVMNLHRCTKAYEELVNDKIQILTKDDIIFWLDKHQLLYNKVKEDYLFLRYNDFRELFFFLEDLVEELQNYSEVEQALKLFTDTDTTSLNQWLDDYYSLAFCKVIGFELGFFNIDTKNKTLKIQDYPNVYFKGDDFFAIIEFNELYFKHYDNYQQTLNSIYYN
ncbi:MAG: hypothetical protein EBQ94_13055 [Flavobacteriales bacterium]|nr:hypothetical protein [Flavobacteriales bacterium]